MASTFAYLTDVRPYKTSWRVQVKTLHAWGQYTTNTCETLEVVFSDENVRDHYISYMFSDKYTYITRICYID